MRKTIQANLVFVYGNSPKEKMLTSCTTFPDFERFVIFTTVSSPLTPGATVMTHVAKWRRLPTVPLGCISAWSRPIIALTAPPNEQTATQLSKCPFIQEDNHNNQCTCIQLTSPFRSCWRVLQTAGGLWCLKIHERESTTKVAGLWWDVCFISGVRSSTVNWSTVKGGWLVQPSGSVHASWKCSLKEQMLIFMLHIAFCFHN